MRSIVEKFALSIYHRGLEERGLRSRGEDGSLYFGRGIFKICARFVCLSSMDKTHTREKTFGIQGPVRKHKQLWFLIQATWAAVQSDSKAVNERERQSGMREVFLTQERKEYKSCIFEFCKVLWQHLNVHLLYDRKCIVRNRQIKQRSLTVCMELPLQAVVGTAQTSSVWWFNFSWLNRLSGRTL